MAVADNRDRADVRVNSADWDIMEVMADGKRYTQQHLYDDIPELAEHSPDWVRQRVSHLHDLGIVQKVGTSAMYELSTVGMAALDLREELEQLPAGGEFAQLVYERAAEIDRATWLADRE